jgi:hypothetical protein
MFLPRDTRSAGQNGRFNAIVQNSQPHISPIGVLSSNARITMGGGIERFVLTQCKQRDATELLRKSTSQCRTIRRRVALPKSYGFVVQRTLLMASLSRDTRALNKARCRG